jgi:hypothetical protein
VTKRWVLKEARFADKRGTLIPVLIEDVEPPFEFGDIQAANLKNWQGDVSHSGYTHLLESVSEVLSTPLPATTDEQNAIGRLIQDISERLGPAAQPEPYEPDKPKRFMPHVRLPNRQTLLSQKTYIIGGVSIVLLASLSLLIPPKLGEETERGTIPVPGVTHTPGRLADAKTLEIDKLKLQIALAPADLRPVVGEARPRDRPAGAGAKRTRGGPGGERTPRRAGRPLLQHRRKAPARPPTFAGASAAH